VWLLVGRGVLVLDDSEREEYRPGLEALQRAGFKSIAFWGISPGEFYNKSTTVFYRPDNCWTSDTRKANPVP
jgi:hypothetical protein